MRRNSEGDEESVQAGWSLARVATSLRLDQGTVSSRLTMVATVDTAAPMLPECVHIQSKGVDTCNWWLAESRSDRRPIQSDNARLREPLNREITCPGCRDRNRNRQTTIRVYSAADARAMLHPESDKRMRGNSHLCTNVQCRVVATPVASGTRPSLLPQQRTQEGRLSSSETARWER